MALYPEALTIGFGGHLAVSCCASWVWMQVLIKSHTVRIHPTAGRSKILHVFVVKHSIERAELCMHDMDDTREEKCRRGDIYSASTTAVCRPLNVVTATWDAYVYSFSLAFSSSFRLPGKGLD